MPTQRGWLVALGAVLLAVTGRLLAVLDLLLVGAAAMALLAGAVAYVHLVRWSVHATRKVRPPRVHAGSASRVELVVRNAGIRRSPLLTVRDPFDGGRRWARFLLAPLAPGETGRAAYRLPTDRRGVYELGPLRIEVGDPFGLARRSAVAAPPTKLTVYPRVDPIRPLPITRGSDPRAGSDHPTAVGAAGEDFYALREYALGDDLRRVHWRSTAKIDELMIRQEEMPWQGRVTVLLDLRQGLHTPASVEVAVSAAASILSASWHQRALVRLVTSDGTDSGFGAGQGHAEAILERLAVVDAHSDSELAPLLGTLRHAGGGGSLVVVGTALTPKPDLDAVARLRRGFGTVTLVVLERSVLDPTAAGGPTPAAPSAAVVRVGGADEFARAWDHAMASRPGRAPAAARR